MSKAEPYILGIDDEASAWDALEWLIENRKDAKSARLIIHNLDWGKVEFNYKGERFDQTVTPSIMKGVVEFQNELHRSIALLSKKDPRVTRLTNSEKSSTELIFRVEKGSSELVAAPETMASFLQKLAENMSGQQALIGFLVMVILYFGKGAVESYFQYRVEEKKVEAETKGREYDLAEKKELFQFINSIVGPRHDRSRILRQAYRTSPTAQAIGVHNRHGIDELIRYADDADQLSIQGTPISSKVMGHVRRASRSTSENVVIKELFRVIAVESDDPSHYIVTLESFDTNQTIVAELSDPIVVARYRKAIQNSEWNNDLIMVHIKGRKVNGQIKDGEITRAYKPRKRK